MITKHLPADKGHVPMNRIDQLMAMILKNRNEQLRLLSEFAVWEDIKRQYPELADKEVRAFGFDVKLSPDRHKRRVPGLTYKYIFSTESIGYWAYNFVCLVDGRVLTLDPIVPTAKARLAKILAGK